MGSCCCCLLLLIVVVVSCCCCLFVVSCCYCYCVGLRRIANIFAHSELKLQPRQCRDSGREGRKACVTIISSVVNLSWYQCTSAFVRDCLGLSCCVVKKKKIVKSIPFGSQSLRKFDTP